MSKYILLTEVYIFIQSFFLIICSDKDVKSNNEPVEFEFLEIKNGSKKDKYIIDFIKEDNGQILEKDVFVKLTKGDIKGKKLKLITNSFMDYKYDDVEGNVYCDDTDLLYNMNEDMFENVKDNIYKIKVREKLNERIFDNFDYILKKNRYHFQLFIQDFNDKDNPIVNKNNYICLVYFENNYLENLKKQYNDYLNKKNKENVKNDIKKNTDNDVKKNVENNKENNIGKNNIENNNIKEENNIVKSDKNKELIEKEEINTDNIIIESENNEKIENIENKENNIKIENELTEVINDESNNNDVFNNLYKKDMRPEDIISKNKSEIEDFNKKNDIENPVYIEENYTKKIEISNEGTKKVKKCCNGKNSNGNKDIKISSTSKCCKK